MKYILAILTLILVLLFPQKAYCGENIDLSFVEYDNTGRFFWHVVELEEPSPHIRGRIENALNSLFTYQADNIYAYPENISILSIHYLYAHVIVNLSAEINNFHGGSMVETIYLGQIIKTLLDIKGIEKVTLLIDSLSGNTPEGIVIKEVSSWQGLMEGITTNTGS